MRIVNHSDRYLARTLIKQVFDPLFITYCLLWIIVHLFRRSGYPTPGINNWLTDFLFVPVAAHLALVFTRCVILKDCRYVYPLIYLLAIALYASIVFEWLSPVLLNKGTADMGDVIAYFAGSVFYCRVHQRMMVRIV